MPDPYWPRSNRFILDLRDFFPMVRPSRLIDGFDSQLIGVLMPDHIKDGLALEREEKVLDFADFVSV